jgi:hypothetical protein
MFSSFICLEPPQGDGAEQLAVRAQRDQNYTLLGPEYKPAALGGKDHTLNRMPDNVKVDLVNNMARAPALWSASTTMKRTESFVSTQRYEIGKRRASSAKRHKYSPPASPVLPKVHSNLSVCPTKS